MKRGLIAILFVLQAGCVIGTGPGPSGQDGGPGDAGTGEPKIQVTPSEVTFLDAPPRSEPYLETVTIRNLGTAELQASWSLSGDSQFTLASDQCQASLPPGTQLDVIIQYASMDTLARHAELRIESNDPHAQKVIVPVDNADVSPRIVVSDCVMPQGSGSCVPSTQNLPLDFGPVPMGQCRQAQVIVENAGGAALHVAAPTFLEGASPDFQFDGPAPGALTVNPVDAFGTTDRKIIPLKYCASWAAARATLEIDSDDPTQASISISLQGGAVVNHPPSCTCQTSTEVAPGDTLTLSSLASCSDPDGQPLQYTWSVVSRPPGSTSPIVVDAGGARFLIDLATTPETPYAFQVTASDPAGLSASCVVTAYAIPRAALHVELVWSTGGNDVDLHLLNAAGSANPMAATGWFSPTNDCYYTDCAGTGLNWGDATQSPRLDIDDSNGYGPENISIARPASGTYTVGPTTTATRAPGRRMPSRASIAMARWRNESAPQPLIATGFFWDVARIDWPGCTVTPLHQTRTVSNGCTGP
jgi:hypothetical protein